MELNLKKCDYCEKLSLETDIFSDKQELGIRGKDICTVCYSIFNAVLITAIDDVSASVGYSVTNRTKVLNALMKISDADVEAHFGTDGIQIKNELIQELSE